MQRTHSIAYFSMEIGVHPDIPTYSGGLGMLAGDCLRSAADLALPICAVTLLHRRGYFQQSLDAAGQQHEEPVRWDPANHMKPVEQRTSIKLRGRKVHSRRGVSTCSRRTPAVRRCRSISSTRTCPRTTRMTAG